MAANNQEKLMLYNAMDAAIREEGRELTWTEIQDSVSALITSNSLRVHAKIYYLAVGNNLRRYLREAAKNPKLQVPKLPPYSESTGLQFSTSMMMVWILMFISRLTTQTFSLMRWKEKMIRRLI
jgi:hypothetical protein